MQLDIYFDSIDKKLDKILDNTTPSNINDNVIHYSVKEWLLTWRELYKVPNVKPGTLYQIDCLINNFIIPSIGELQLNRLDGITLQRYLLTIKAQRQREHIFGVLRDSLTRAYTLKLLPYNPISTVEIPKHIRRKIVALDREQEEVFVKACQNDKYGYLFLIMLYAGLRRGEAQVLTYNDINLEERRISVTKTINDLNQINTPKTASGVRKVPITDNLLPYVLQFKDNRNIRIFDCTKNTITKHFASILEESSLTGLGITTHSLRHTFATRCAEKGINVKTAQKWLGHSTPQMTLEIYTHINQDFEVDEIARLNAL